MDTDGDMDMEVKSVYIGPSALEISQSTSLSSIQSNINHTPSPSDTSCRVYFTRL